MRNIARLIVHCSASRASRNETAADINKDHLARGFTPTKDSPAIGYHIFIRRDGTIEKGRPEARIGAHAHGYNSDSLGVCLAGGVKEDGRTPENNFTPAQFESLEKVLEDWQSRYGPGLQVIGHGQLPGVAKACPSFDARGWWEARHAQQS